MVGMPAAKVGMPAGVVTGMLAAAGMGRATGTGGAGAGGGVAVGGGAARTR